MASVLWIPVIFSVATLGLYALSVNFPTCTSASSNCSSLTFPTNLPELQTVSHVLKEYKTNHFGYVFAIFVSAYLYKQTFAIPGSIFLNLLSGALYGVPCGVLLSCTLTAGGATFCFLLSKMFGKQHLLRLFPNKVKYFQDMIDETRNSLFFFLLFLRLLPMSPNWFVNMVSPVFNIPIHLFTLSAFLGLLPYNFICVQTGSILSQITSIDDIFTVGTVLQMVGMALVALLPGFIIKTYQKKREKND